MDLFDEDASLAREIEAWNHATRWLMPEEPLIVARPPERREEGETS